MTSEPGVFEAFYAGPLQHPILLWLAAAVATLSCLLRRGLDPRLRRTCAALGALSLLDAWLTANRIFGLPPLRGWLASAVPLCFVLLGDLRYLLLLTSARAPGGIRIRARGLLVAAGLTAIVPVLSQLVAPLAVAFLPESVDASRVLFFVYEVAFASLAAILIVRCPAHRELPWLRRVSAFVVVYYLLWAAADLVLLTTGSDLGYLLRVVPNLLYYGGLIAVVGWAAPAVEGSSGLAR